jgi:signal transduction histidine kinase
MEETAPPDELRKTVEDLRASRARIMATANDQRRDIERGLHDGVQQELFALAVNLQLAEALAGSDPAALTTLYAEMRRDVHDAIEGVRTLARGVYPPLLADLGLGGALREMATKLGIAARIDPTLDRYATNIEATVYFCCLEAVETSGAGDAPGATLHVWRERESLLFEVNRGSRPTRRDGDDFESVRTGMSDRIGALGGTLTVVEDSEQIRVRGEIPLGSDRSATLG